MFFFLPLGSALCYLDFTIKLATTIDFHVILTIFFPYDAVFQYSWEGVVK